MRAESHQAPTHQQTIASPGRGAWVSALTWPEVEARIEQGAVALLPIGAGAKQHGRHLPMNTDQLQADWLADQLARDLNLLIWPTITYGYYPAFTEFPGSCSLTQAQFRELVAALARQIHGYGVGHVCLLNTGVSTRPALELVARRQPRTYVINVYSGPACRAASRRLLRQPRGGHADERETSIMLAIAPEQVNMHRAARNVSRAMRPGRFRRGDRSHPNYTPSGVFGDAKLASREQGEQILTAILADLRQAITPLTVELS